MKKILKNANFLNTKTFTQCLLIVTSLLFIQVTHAQETTAESPTEPTREALEEVVVTGQKSLLNMRFDMLKAEDVVYDIYNETYAGTEFEMVCDHPAYRDNFTGLLPSALKRVCTTSYVKDQNTDALQEALSGYNPGAPDYSEHNAELKQKLLELYSENPSFRKSVDDLAAMRKNYHTNVAQAEEEDGFFKRLFNR